MVKASKGYKGTQPLTTNQRLAARLIAENELTFERIAEEIGVSQLTLANWRTRDDFQQVVRDVGESIVQKTSTLKYADRNRRIGALNNLAESMEQIIRERAEWYTKNDENAPGGRSGLIVRTRRAIGNGKVVEIIEEDQLDRALVSEYKDTLIHIAKERGEWSDKKELSGPGGAPLLPIKEIVINVPANYEEEDDFDDDD